MNNMGIEAQNGWPEDFQGSRTSKNDAWTAESVREYLPDVSAIDAAGRTTRTGQLTGRLNDYATLWALGQRVEVSWKTLAHCLNERLPVRV